MSIWQIQGEDGKGCITCQIYKQNSRYVGNLLKLLKQTHSGSTGKKEEKNRFVCKSSADTQKRKQADRQAGRQADRQTDKPEK